MNKNFTAQQLGNTIGQMRYEIDELLDGNDFEACLSRIEDCAREIVNLVEKYK